MIDPRAAEVLDFWFGQPGEPHHLQTRPEWFRKDDAFDALIAQPLRRADRRRGCAASWRPGPHSRCRRWR